MSTTDKYPLYLDGKTAGELTVVETGMYIEFRAVCHAFGPALLRAFLVGERGETRLGVLAPEGGVFTICRRLSRQETVGLGKLLRCEVRRNEDSAWDRVRQPEQLFPAAFFSQQLKGVSGILTKMDGERRYMAIPYDPKCPFPLNTLFCFAKIFTIEEAKYAVFIFDKQGIPIMHKK